jgi:hypothetical protein
VTEPAASVELELELLSRAPPLRDEVAADFAADAVPALAPEAADRNARTKRVSALERRQNHFAVARLRLGADESFGSVIFSVKPQHRRPPFT